MSRSAVENDGAFTVAEIGQVLFHLVDRNVDRARIGSRGKLHRRAHVHHQRASLDLRVQDAGSALPARHANVRDSKATVGRMATMYFVEMAPSLDRHAPTNADDLPGHAWHCVPRSNRISSMSTPEHRDHHGNPDDLKAYIARLDDPGRDEWQRPDVVLATLGITKESVVCEIGTGTGYFSLRLAKQAAWVYAIDVETQLLSLLRERAASARVQNLTPVLGLPLDPLIPPTSCDLILTVNTFHHVPEKAAYLRRLQQVLRPGGRLAIVDFHKRELPVGPPVDHKLAREECLEQIRAAGLQVLSEHDILPHQYFLITAA